MDIFIHQCLLANIKTYIPQHCVNTGCRPDDLPRAMKRILFVKHFQDLKSQKLDFEDSKLFGANFKHSELSPVQTVKKVHDYSQKFTLLPPPEDDS